MTLTEARANLPSLLDRVAAGEEITVTRHGHAVAVMVRPDRLRSRRAEEMYATAARIRQMIEDAVGHPVDVSTSCGLGRREPDAAMAAMDRIKLLLSDRSPAGLD